MTPQPRINIRDFFYDLPAERIAQFPLSRRDESKLLVYRQGQIADDRFFNLPDHLPGQALMVYNKTRVIQARLQFQKETGALIEIFCLEPMAPTREIQQAFEQTSGVVWKCLVGNSKKWKSGELVHRFAMNGEDLLLKAIRKEKTDEYSLIEFQWDPEHKNFSEILQEAGIMPLPPYMKRPSEDTDKIRYQTIYAKAEGSVAAPTAGLHFTPEVFEKLNEKNIRIREVTLHVGAGTFKPVSAPDVAQHEMHTEQIHVSRETIEEILRSREKSTIAIGTTTLRTLESLYWHGVKALVEKNRPTFIDIRQWDPYLPNFNAGIPVEKALAEVLSIMDENNMAVLSGQTQLMIVPGYRVRIPDILVTNFHMPQSTLLLLVSAFIGDAWKSVYDHALAHDFRFLSYGDSCLFFRDNRSR